MTMACTPLQCLDPRSLLSSLVDVVDDGIRIQLGLLLTDAELSPLVCFRNFSSASGSSTSVSSLPLLEKTLVVLKCFEVLTQVA